MKRFGKRDINEKLRNCNFIKSKKKPVLKPILQTKFLETNFFQLSTKILSHLDDHFVCDQGGGTPLDSDLEQVPGEEAYSPAGGARGDGGDAEGGGQIYHQEGFQFDAARSNSAATPPGIAWGRLRVAQWTPADVVYLDCWDLV